MPSKFRHPKVVIKKLGREKAWGTYCDGEIEIDPSTRGKARLEVLVHEYLHHLDPSATEATVTRYSKRLADFLHKNHVRITEPESIGLNG